MHLQAQWIGLTLLCSILNASAQEPPERKANPARVSTLRPEELKNFDAYPEEIKKFTRRALELTEQNLTYLFGSSDPQTGGMDCSGTIYHLLQSLGIKGVPRQSDEMCDWITKESKLHLTKDATSLSDPQFADLKPGDLVFWTGTYNTPSRPSGVSHVMLFLGKRSKDDAALVFGASDGRTYDGQKMCGVSVFDFKIPKKESKAALLGYGSIPEVRPKAGIPDAKK